MGRRRWAAAVAVVAVLVAGAPAAAAQPAASTRSGGGRLLDVPYLPQSEDLCGGAALAMVMRYWGEPQIYPDDFAALVDHSAAGIRTDVLSAEAARRGWLASRLDTTGEAGVALAAQVDQGRPVLVLIEVRPARYHYVVVVAWTGTRVVIHDPAQAPFRVIPRADFERDWAAAGRWALLVVPSAARVAPPPLPGSEHGASALGGPCATLIQTSVDHARAGDIVAAEPGLLAAVTLCPGVPAAWRELAGLRFLQRRWAEAGALAERAASLDPLDVPGLDLLGTSRFLAGQPGAALQAWNGAGRPVIDLVGLTGVARTRHPVVIGLLDLPPRTLLTAARFERASRRLAALPSAAVTHLAYAPAPGGLVGIEATVAERPALPQGAVSLTALAVRAAVQRDLRVDVASPTGSGELWTAAWRWQHARPRVAFALAVPSVAGLPGVTTIAGTWARTSLAAPRVPGGPEVIVIQERRRAALELADWASGHVRWQAGAALDRWGPDHHLSAAARLDLRLARDTMAVTIDGGAWTPAAPDHGFATAGVAYALRSTREPARPVWTAHVGLMQAAAAAPVDLWPAAAVEGTGQPVLRAHPLLDSGVIGGAMLARRLAHATAEYQHPVRTVAGGALRVAIFADAARAWQRWDVGAGASWQADGGLGLRVVLPGAAGTLRADVATGLRDGRVAVSAGWIAPWPGR